MNRDLAVKRFGEHDPESEFLITPSKRIGEIPAGPQQLDLFR